MAQVRPGPGGPVAEADRVRAAYSKRARRYESQAALYHLMGFRDNAYRRAAVAALHLREGDTVVELGVGTGRNLPMLVAAVGPSGRVVGVDLTPAMLDEARRKIDEADWDNVELIQCDAADAPLPESVDGVLATFALNLGPRYAEVIARAADALAPAGRLAVLDLRRPRGWPTWLLRPMLLAVRPFCVTLQTISRDVPAAMRRHLDVHQRRFYFGFAYLAVGRRAQAASAKPGPRLPASERP